MSENKIVDPRVEALQYMKENKIQILFDFLGAKLAREKPANPNEFLIQELQSITEAKATNQPVIRQQLILNAID